MHDIKYEIVGGVYFSERQNQINEVMAAVFKKR